MSKILIVCTSWYEDHLKKMIQISKTSFESEYDIQFLTAPGAIELAALAKNYISKENFSGVLFLGIIIRGETSHYDLVSQETFRSIGNLALEFPDKAIINNVICIENETQLVERIEKNTLNNCNALRNLIHEKSC